MSDPSLTIGLPCALGFKEGHTLVHPQKYAAATCYLMPVSLALGDSGDSLFCSDPPPSWAGVRAHISSFSAVFFFSP